MHDPKTLSAAAMAVALAAHAELPSLLGAEKATRASRDKAAHAAAVASMVAASRRQGAGVTLARLFDREDGDAGRIGALQDIAAGRPVREGLLDALSRAGLIRRKWHTASTLTDHGSAVLALHHELTTTPTPTPTPTTEG